MAKVELSLSRRVQKDSGKAEILVRFYHGSKFNMRAKSGIMVNPDYFEYYIDRGETAKLGVRVPDNTETASIPKAERFGYVLRTNGKLVCNKRVETPEVKEINKQIEDVEALKTWILACYNNTTDKDIVGGDWLKTTVEKKLNPEKFTPKEKEKPSFYKLAETYLSKKQFSVDHTKAIRVLVRDVARYEGFTRETDENRKDFTFDVDKVTRNDIEDFFDYLRNEHNLAIEYPAIFKKLLSEHPENMRKGQSNIVVRGENTIIKLAKKLKAFFVWLYDSSITTNRPFDGIKIGSEKFGTPYYISIEERNKIAETDIDETWEQLGEEQRKEIRETFKCNLPIKTLNVQRDVFVFHCFVGCRVGDLLKLTQKNIENGILVYTPHKTKDEEESVQARIPLHPKAIALIKKYNGIDKDGRLFPFISAQKYNQAIKVFFTLAGITRNVEVRNAKTGEPEIKPINEIASSHIARRTFVGNAYFKVSDPSIICKMSGHVEGSRAFARYRKIEDSTLIDVINQIG